MKLTIFTPTHDTKHLKELEKSIKNNIHKDWEWVILLNNGATYKASDKRIKIYQSKTNSTNVGALKKEACNYATGDVLVEVDHDDLITPDCLSKIAIAFEDNTVGFVYSDNAKLSDNFVPYNPYYGWSYRMFNWQGKELIAMNEQPLTPARLGHIWFAPDHVRAWRKSVYDFVGGHDETLPICDDLDLIHKTYLVSKFHHIPEVLYIYRITGDNTWLQRNADIQNKSQEIFHSNIYALANRFCQINNLFQIDLCGGFNSPDGFISIDKYNGTITADLDKGIPFADNSCGVVRAYDAIEHLKDGYKTMSEIHRVLAPGGVFISMTPSTDGRGAWQDPTHVSFWNENSFWYYLREEQMKYIHNTKIKFFESVLRTIYPTDWHKANNIPYVNAILEKI